MLYIYDAGHEPPLPIEPAPGGLVVVVPSTSSDLDELKAFFSEAATELGLRALVTGD